MTYYSQRKSILNGEPQAVVNKYGTRRAMERQFHLFCANACDGEEFVYDVDSIEWGTVESGVIERKVYNKPVVVEAIDYDTAAESENEIQTEDETASE